jgi:DNA-binding transcriptional ArsR family regulator
VSDDQTLRPPDVTLDASNPAQLKALGHPLRQRLLFALAERPTTISQLAVALSAQKGNIGHHLKVLREAGLVQVVQTRQVRGGTEHYYQRTAQRIYVGGPPTVSTTAMLQAVADEITATVDEPLLHLRHVRLTVVQAERLNAAMSQLIDQVVDAGPNEPRYGLLIGMYKT